MTRVLIIEPAGQLWGSERALLEFIAGMPGIEPAVCCPPRVPLIPELDKLSIRILPYFIRALHKKSRLERLWAAIGVIRACLRFRPEVIYLNQGGCYRVVLPAAVLFDLPIIAHVRLHDDVAYFAQRRPNPRRLRGLIAISSSIAEELRRDLPPPTIPQHMLYDSYVPVASWAELNSASRIGDRVACVGRIDQNKGHSILIEALQCLTERGQGIDCIMVGDGHADIVRPLMAAAQSGAASTRIHWLGIRNDVISLLGTCKLAICPSHREALGRVIFEAWDAGALPVVCKTSGGAAEIVAAADGGILYADQTPGLLATAIQMAIRLPQSEVSRLVANGRAWMAKNCDAQQYNSALAKILDNAVQSQHNSR